MNDAEVLITNHLAAFRQANPHQDMPSLAYERGWFVFRFHRNGGVPTRVRRTELLQMTQRLLERRP